MRSASRLDASTRTCGAARRIALARSADGLTRCSQLSKTSRTRSGFRCAHSVWTSGRSGSSRTPSTCAASLDDERRVAQRCQIQEPRAVRELGHQLGRDLQRQPRLAEAAHAEQRQQPRGGRCVLDLVELALAADERGGLQRQVVRDLPRRQPALAIAHDAIDLLAIGRRSKRCTRLAHLEQLDRLGDALHHPVPVRLHLQARLAERFARLGREQDLPASRDRHHAGCGGLGEAFDLQRLGAACHVRRAVLAQHHRPDVQAGARLQRHLKRRQPAVVRRA